MRKLKRILSVVLAGAMALTAAACGSSGSTNGSASSAPPESAAESEASSAQSDELSYANTTLGTSYTDITATIKFLTHRTDMQKDDYTGTTWKTYLAEFNKMYPNITVNIEGITDYASDALLRLQSSDWGDVMMIPAVDKGDLSTYFLSFGTLGEMENQIRFARAWEYDNEVYGVPYTGNAQGIVYNKKIFQQAGVTDLPKTPDEFMAALKAIKEKTDAIPLYTNYFAQWTMGAWDAYISGSATGDTQYMNQKLLHKANPFSDPGDGTGSYNVYKILYDAVSEKLTEDDYTTTDWESSKTKINNGEIACMVLGSWAYSQMVEAGPNGDDIGYMPFPITVDGKQYASAGADYSFGINVNSSKENKEAAMVFVKWMTEDSGFSFNEGGIPIKADDNNYPDLFKAFQDVELVEDEPAAAGEEDLLNTLNSDSELNINGGGNDKIMKIVEHAANGDESYDDIMKEWNQVWSDAQTKNNVEVTE